MKAQSSGTSEYIFISLNVPVSSTQVRKRQWCKQKLPLNYIKFGSVGSATYFNTNGPEFDAALGISNVFQQLFANGIIQACLFYVLLKVKILYD